MDELDDQQGRRPRHNESTSEVSHDEVDPQCDVGDEGGGGGIIRNAWKRHDFVWFVDNTREQDVGRNEDGAKGAL